MDKQRRKEISLSDVVSLQNRLDNLPAITHHSLVEKIKTSVDSSAYVIQQGHLYIDHEAIPTDVLAEIIEESKQHFGNTRR